MALDKIQKVISLINPNAPEATVIDLTRSAQADASVSTFEVANLGRGLSSLERGGSVAGSAEFAPPKNFQGANRFRP